jgi:hypothetical protein
LWTAFFYPFLGLAALLLGAHEQDTSSEELELLVQTQVQDCQGGFMCLICGKTVAQRGAVKRHMREVHTTPVQYHCPPCNKVFNNRSFHNHVVSVHKFKGIDFEKFRVQ